MPYASGSPGRASTSSRETTTKNWTQPAVAGAFTVEPPICVSKIDGQKIVLCHYPMADWQGIGQAPPRTHPQRRRHVWQGVQPQAGPSALRRRLRCQRALPGEPRRAEGMVRRSRRAVRPGEMALVGQRDRRQAGRARAGGVQAERAIVIDRKKPR